MVEQSTKVTCTIARLHNWFETMRETRGYTGPISHWWEPSLIYCGPMADWRYEGLICGYLNLYRSTGNPLWLDYAKRAGDDLVAALLPTGNFRNSSFQQGPMEGGTPHEAAVDIGLLELAQALKDLGDESWQSYFKTAQINISNYLIGQLWDGQGFRDQSWNKTQVPNKNATAMEALVLVEELGGDPMQPYILGAVECILSAQVSEPGPRQGATIHLGTGSHQLAIGIYSARCLTAMVRLYQRYPQAVYLDSACRMLEFLFRLLAEDGTLFGFYPGGRPIACPTWISASGDLLRAMITLKPYTSVPDTAINQLADLLIRRQQPSGGIPTAFGLGNKGDTRKPKGLPDFRDVIPVVGWCDKAFRALTMLAHETGIDLNQASVDETVVECLWKGRDCLYQENAEWMQLTDLSQGQILFEWRKSEWYPNIYKL